MRIDMSGTIKKSLDKALANAIALEKKKDYNKAASAYENVAKMMNRYADAATTKADEKRRREKAKNFSERAEKLKSGKVVVTAKGESTTTKEEEKFENEIASLIYKSDVTWDDIGGLEETKREIKYTYGLTLAKKPEGIHLKGWRNMLFYGSPGTGKTLLAAATSNGLNAIFFNVKASNLLSKYFGESTKLVSALYSSARSAADEGFSVIFVDEFDALSMKRGEGSESGAERRVLSTLLAELDGLADKGEDRFVLTIAATNAPWDLDDAVLSRFQKRIFIPLPDAEARREILKIHLEKKGHKVEYDFDELIKRTEYFSGRDIERLCNEAINNMVSQENKNIPNAVDEGRGTIESYQIKVRPLNNQDFENAFVKAKIDKKRVAEMEEKYKNFFEIN